ncbi:sigma-70 family RNA polymerase sigma factor [Flavobacterium sp. F372]|uniref:Sigma-70 family RNA polymerase sigma factor n=1 Tax=Flavobacterium bernardetii TaxID=2813823 RepID=A0ABR7IUH8_9FLAO|nr:sigma-70 family RNA polymerase sigma factor [Flavobacterium bernardetii]MBC5833429.1 sigma-70 family RNA polymerase sigma factor [Flavobacterium bernardetii]NHF68661.1 sigma-70 family RNA polymerase sigma factor [Flavobacterium bernardetii]
MIDIQLIQACKKQQRDAQRQVYELLARKLYYTCSRYLKKEEEIEEAMADAFYIIFTKIDQLKEELAFEGWAKKIAVNQCLMQLKKNVNFNLYLEDVSLKDQPLTDEMCELEEEDLLNLLNYLPDGCKTVFSLFVIEGFSHKDIAEKLQISEGTSKSQLNVAKTKLKDLVNTFYYQKVN